MLGYSRQNPPEKPTSDTASGVTLYMKNIIPRDLLTTCLQTHIDKMSSSHSTLFLYIAPVLPASVALTYTISVVFKWEQALERRISGRKTNGNKDMKVSLPLDETDTKLLQDSTWTSHIISAAVPIAHHSFTTVKLWNMDKFETISTEVCLVQIGIVMTEFAIDYCRHHVWQRGDLFALGASWIGITLRPQLLILRSGVTGITSAICIAVLSIFSILPEQPETDQNSTEAHSQVDKPNKEGSLAAKSTPPRYSNVHLHIFSVSLLLVYLIHDYPTISSRLLYRFLWMGSSSHLLIAFGLLFLHVGINNWRTTSRYNQTFVQHLKAFVSQVSTTTPESVGCVLIGLSVLGLWISLFFVSSYLTSCIGFRTLILGRPRTLPRFLDGGLCGGFVYQQVVLVQFFLRRDQFRGQKPGQTFRLVLAFGAAFGQTITGLVVLAIGLYGLQLFGWIHTSPRSSCCSTI